MSRLSFLMGLFLSVTVTGIVLLLSVLASTPIAIMIPRCIVVFFLFGLLGVILGSALEVLIMPEVVANEVIDIKKQLERSDSEETLSDLGDLLDISANKHEGAAKLKESESALKEDIGDLFDENKKT